MSDGRVIIDTRLDSNGAVRDLHKMTKTINRDTRDMSNSFKPVEQSGVRSMTNISKSASNLGSVLSKVGALLASAFAVSKLISIGKQAVEIASDVQEVQNVVDTAFGDMAYKMEQFADVAIETYGISKLTAKQTGSTMMAMAKGLGLASDEASDMALNLTGLSADMASFYNISQDMASTALKSIFTGETETLKRFGIVMTEANLSAFALSQGINKSLKNMTQAEKVQLRYAYVMQQTSLAQGDFAKTSDSWANQTRILSERWKEFLSIAGNGLIQLLTPALKVINELMQQLIVGITALANYFGFAFEATATAGVADMESAMDDYTDSTNAAAKAQKALLGGYDKLQVISSDSGTSETNAEGGLGGTSAQQSISIDKTEVKSTFNLLAGLADRFSSFSNQFSSFSDQMSSLGSSLGTVFNTNVVPMFDSFVSNASLIFSSWGTTMGDIFSSLWNDFIYPNLSNLIVYGIPLISSFITDSTNLFTQWQLFISDITGSIWKDAVSPMLQLITKQVEDVWILLTEWYDEYGSPIVAGISELLSKIFDIFNDFWQEWMKPIFDTIYKVLNELWDNHLKPLWTNVSGLIGDFVLMAVTFYNKFIAPIVGYLVRTFGPVFTSVFNTIASIVSKTIGSVIDIVSSIVSVLRSVIQFVRNVFSGDWKSAWVSIKNVFVSIWNVLIKVVKGIINRMIGFINAIIGGIETMMNFLVGIINKLSFDVPDWVPGIGGEHFGFNLSEVSLSKIPYLAQGAVLPANNPFLAVVGDQKHGTNIEAPLDTIVKAFEQVMNNRSNDSGDIILNIDGNELFRWTRKKNAEYRAKYGVSAF